MQQTPDAPPARDIDDAGVLPIDTALAETICEAIGRKTCLTAIYNKATLRLAPHVVYTKYGDLFVDAVVVQRDGKAPKGSKLGAFKLAGLADLASTELRFAPRTGFDARDSKYAGNSRCAVEV